MSGHLPAWAAWSETSEDYTVGAEEEVMLLVPGRWRLAQEIDRVLETLEPELGEHVTAETHQAALELATRPHRDVRSLASEMRELRGALEAQLEGLGLRAAAAGTHPFTVWQETLVSTGPRYAQVYGSMRELARREPTFGLHVHVGVSSPAAAIELYNRLRLHLPLLLALSANSPLWQGRDTGLASVRTPLFQAFPRVGIPRPFASYRDWVEAVDVLLRCDAFADPTFLWWDVRPQPRFGTVEVRIMDVQSTVAEAAGLVALVHSLARLELEEGYAPPELLELPEVLHENRFIAARDGMDARFIDPLKERSVPARLLLEEVLTACLPHARELGCQDELVGVAGLAEQTGARRQLDLLREGGSLPRVVARLAAVFAADDAGAPADSVDAPGTAGALDRLSDASSSLSAACP
jgi:glutamate---cysteine ligase / carboxylate-amine ligase